MNIGIYLKQLRLEKGYTLNDVAVKLGMSASFLSQLENMKLSPSLESLEKILNYYAVNLSDFFRQVEQRRFIIVKKGDEKPLHMLEEGIKLTPLASKLQNNSLETYIISFTGSTEIETAILPKEINGERLIYIMKGSVTIIIDQETPVKLFEGDSVNYKSYVPCRVNNFNGDEAEILVSGMPPILL
jgi:transcriptional regulator with XRE-family HTH domain